MTVEEKPEVDFLRRGAISVALAVGLTAAVFAPVLVPWLLGSGSSSGGAMVRMVSVAPLHSAGGSYPGVRVAVDNGGDAAVEGCAVKAYDALRYSEKAEDAPILGESERFALPPRGGHVATVSIQPPRTDEGAEASTIAGPLIFGIGCAATESVQI